MTVIESGNIDQAVVDAEHRQHFSSPRPPSYSLFLRRNLQMVA